MGSDRLSRASITVYDAALPGTRVLRVTTGNGHMTRPTDTPANTFFLPVLKQPADMSRQMFAPGTTSGRSKVGLGDVIITNADGALDGWQNYAFDGWPITIEDGTVDGGFTSVLVATMDGTPEFGAAMITIHLRDRQAELDVPLQTNLYLGNNALPAGLEGVSDLKGKPKPFCLGQVMNVPAECVNTPKLIYQVHDGALAAIGAVYDRGIALAGGQLPAASTIALLNEAWTCTYGNGLYVMAGYDSVNLVSRVYTSPDRVTWTRRNSPAGVPEQSVIRWYASAYSDALGLFVVAGSNGKLITSADGINWANATSAFGTTRIIAVTWGNGLFVAVGVGGAMTTSPDGVTWTARTSGVATDLNGIAYGNGLFVAAGSSGTVITSPDGITWTSRTNSFGAGTVVRAITFGQTIDGASIYVAVGDGGIIVTSLDGGTWSVIRKSGLTTNLYSIAFGAGQFYIVGQTGTMLGSKNGVDWTVRDPGFATTYCYDVCFGAPGWMVCGDLGKFSASSIGVYASAADLQDDTLAPAPGEVKVYLTGGYFRLGSKPAGQVTADVFEGATSADRTVAQLFKRALLKAGKSAADYVAADLVALDALNSAVCGLWINDSTNASALLDQIAGSIWAWWAPDRAGLYRIKQFAAPSGASTFSFSANDLRKPLEVTATSDAGKGVPAYRTIVRYARNYTVQTTDLAAGVDVTRRAFVGDAWRASKYDTAGVQTAHLLAPVITEDSCLVSEADALAEATRRQGIRGTRRDRFPLLVELNDANSQIDFGDVGTLTHKRFGLAAGTLVRVLGAEPNKAKNEVLLTVWR